MFSISSTGHALSIGRKLVDFQPRYSMEMGSTHSEENSAKSPACMVPPRAVDVSTIACAISPW